MGDEIQRLITVWDANTQRIEAKLTNLVRSNYATARRVETDWSRVRIGISDQALSAATSRLGSFGGILGTLGPLGIAAGVGMGALAAGLHQAREAMNWADELGDTADRMRITAEQLQVLDQTVEHFGGNAEQGRQALDNLTAAIGAMQTGIGSRRTGAAFEALGITPEMLRNVNSGIDLLPMLADRIAAAGTAAEQAQIARRLGVEALLPILRQGSAGVRAYEERLRSLGAVVSNETVGSMNDLAERTREADTQMQAASHTLSATLAPAMAALETAAARAITQVAGLVGWLQHFDSLDNQTGDAINRVVASRRRAAVMRHGSWLEAVSEGMPGLGGTYERQQRARENDAAAMRATGSLADLILQQAIAGNPAPPATSSSGTPPTHAPRGGGGRARGGGRGGRGAAPREDPLHGMLPQFVYGEADRDATVDLNRPFDSSEIQQIATDGLHDAAGALAEGLAEHEAETRQTIESAVQGGLEAAIRGGWPGLIQWMGQQLLQTLTQSVASSLSNILAGAGSKGGVGTNIFGTIASAFVGHNASGTDNWRGGMTWVGERGPELLSLPGGSRIYPAGMSAAMARGGDVRMHMTINLEGANGDATIHRIAYQAAAEGAQQAVALSRKQAPGWVAQRQTEGR